MTFSSLHSNGVTLQLLMNIRIKSDPTTHFQTTHALSVFKCTCSKHTIAAALWGPEADSVLCTDTDDCAAICLCRNQNSIDSAPVSDTTVL
jgi:hypothetical protein